MLPAKRSDDLYFAIVAQQWKPESRNICKCPDDGQQICAHVVCVEGSLIKEMMDRLRKDEVASLPTRGEAIVAVKAAPAQVTRDRDGDRGASGSEQAHHAGKVASDGDHDDRRYFVRCNGEEDRRAERA